MKKALIILFSIMSCTAFAQCNTMPYTIHFDIVEKVPGQIVLVVDMKLADGSHFVSPYSSDRFSGRFRLSLDENAPLVLAGQFTETPRTVEIFDPHPFVNGLVNWVHKDTRYEYPMQQNTSGDVEVSGVVGFTIEPRCTYEQIPFVIQRKEGELTVNKGGC